jgi:hypothetical protein
VQLHPGADPVGEPKGQRQKDRVGGTE